MASLGREEVQFPRDSKNQMSTKVHLYLLKILSVYIKLPFPWCCFCFSYKLRNIGNISRGQKWSLLGNCPHFSSALLFPLRFDGMLPLQFSRKKATRKPLMTLSLPSAAFGLERWKGNQECRLQITSGDSISGLDTRQKRRSRWSRENEKDSSICSLQYLKLQMHVFYSGCSFLLLSILQKK